MRFPEEFLHFVWQFRLFNQQKLALANGEAVQILHVGFKNSHAGPDFTQAKIKIGETVWVGNIEIHVNAGEWNAHGHQTDDAYNNVVLHVVYNNDAPVYSAQGLPLPTLVLNNRIEPALVAKYQSLIADKLDFPCQARIGTVDEFVVNGFLDRILIERLAEKTTQIFEKVQQLKGNWDEVFYHFMARSFGFKVNSLPMELLAQTLPQQLFAKHKEQPLQLQALLFGQAGFLQQQFNDVYPQKLKAEYAFLKAKYQLTPIAVSNWKFLRMRPQNFPTLRLAQFAALIQKSAHLFSKILEIDNTSELRALFENLPLNEFWKTHYHFNKEARKVLLQLGDGAVDSLLINTVSVFLFAYGKFTGQENYVTRALKLLESIAAERNSIVDLYVKAGYKANNATQTQALLQLKHAYCDRKNCLSCAVGVHLLKRGS